MRRARVTAVAIALFAVLAADAGTQAGSHPVTRLSIVVRDGSGGVARATLHCAGHERAARGFLRGKGARRLCERALELRRFLATQPDPMAVCTEVYGGPQTARVSGSVSSRAVDRRFHRRDGCGIADWSRARVLLGGEPGGRDHRCRGWCHPEPLTLGGQRR